MSDPVFVKHGDANHLTLDLGVELGGYADAVVHLARYGQDPVDVTGTIDGNTVTVDLPTDLPAGRYDMEVEMTPGPHTYPSDGYVRLIVQPDLG